ncbi:hypothetical protein UlMin_015593 [Ulmus minor]
MQTLIEAFTVIFQEPQQLPPVREIEHCIPLKEGTEPTNVRPYNPNWNMHLEHVKQDFEILRHHTFVLKLKKCAFGQQELEYLGHIVTAHGVKVDQNKIQAMLDWPRPTNVSKLRGFLGLTDYYRKFVCNYGILARPLTTLLKKGQLGWTAEAETSFKLVQQAMTTTPTLPMPNFQ